jgi:dolichyl-phosphate-mannose-protein mannosyltransferase
VIRRRPIVDAVLAVCLVVSVGILLAILLHGGPRLRVGPWRVTVHLHWPVLLSAASAALLAWRRGMRGGLLLWLVVVFVYCLTGRTMAGDTIAARHLPLSLLREGNFDLDEFTFLYTPTVPYYLARVQGHIVSTHPPWAAVFALPIYLVPVAGGMSARSPLLVEVEKLAAAVITALSVVVLFCALRHLTRTSIAWLVALVYALGTSSFSTSSQGLWQHGPSQLLIALAVYCLVRSADTPWCVWSAAFFVSAAVLCRPSNALLVVPILAWLIHEHRRELGRVVLAALPPLGVFLAYNWYYWGSPVRLGFAGGMFDVEAYVWWPSATLSSALPVPLGTGLLGLLVSPGRGLFVYSPIFLLSLVGVVLVWIRPSPLWLRYLSLAPLPLMLVASKWSSWWGGWSYGPRMLADATPILSVFLVPPLERYGGKAWLRSAFGVLAAASIGLHALGAFNEDRWNWDPQDVDHHPERLWSWRDSPPVYYARRLLPSDAR